jgi:hypothetical protein
VSDRGDGDVIRDALGRRLREHDRHGTLVSALTWAAGGRLAEAGVRLPDGGWLGIAPGAAHDPRWGVSDLLRLGVAPLTHCQAVDWACIDAIPTLAQPARLPAGGGSAVLNLLAALAADQRRPALAYRGPYPTEQLFLTLLESFVWENTGDDSPDPLAAFMAGGLTWTPAPHARIFEPGGVCVQWRTGVEKLAWRGRSYHRSTTQGIERHSAHRLHDVADGVRASLWALGAPLEEHVRLTRNGDVIAAALPAPEGAPVQPLAADIAAGIVAIVVAGSAAPLAESLEAVAAGLAFEWGPLAGDLAIVTGERARLSTRLRGALGRRLAGAERASQVRLGFAALADLAHALGDALRARAQARLAAAPVEAQAAALARPRSPAAAAGAAQTIGRAVERLLEETGQLLA